MFKFLLEYERRELQERTWENGVDLKKKDTHVRVNIKEIHIFKKITSSLNLLI